MFFLLFPCIPWRENLCSFKAHAEERIIKQLVLINPNGNRNATSLMVEQAQKVLGAGVRVLGYTNTQAPPLLATAADMQLAEQGVLALGRQAKQAQADAIMVAAFSDPGLAELRKRVSVPVVGIGESVFIEAAASGLEACRRFGIVTITPDARLLASFVERAQHLGYGELFCGTRVTQGDAQALLTHTEQLDRALAVAIRKSIADGAQAVIMGGGPLSSAALRLQPQFSIPLLSPVASAARAVIKRFA